MSYSFFFQAPNREDADTLIVDGRKLEFGTDERQREFASLNKEADQYMWHPVPWSTVSIGCLEAAKSKLRDWRQKTPKRYFAKGYFNELDDCGRHVGFLFCSDLPAGEALEQLIAVARSEGFTLHPDVEAKFRENESCRRRSPFSKKKTISLLVILMMIAAVAAWLILR